MPKGALESSNATTYATQVRDALRQLEIKAASIPRQHVDVEALLVGRDAVEDMLERAQQEGVDVRPERGRAEALDGLLRTRARRIMHLMADTGGLKGARERHSPPTEHWWWYLDIYVQQRVRKSIKRTAIIVACIVAVLATVDIIMTKFFGPTPTQSAFNDLTDQAESALSEGNDEQAISAYEQAVATISTDADTWAYLAVLYERNGRTEDAETAFAEAEKNSESQVMFLFTKARAYLILGETDQAYEIAEQAVNTDSTSPYAYYVLGEALEAKEDTSNAATAFDIAAELAYDQGEDILYALARQRQAVLISGGM